MNRRPHPYQILTRCFHLLSLIVSCSFYLLCRSLFAVFPAVSCRSLSPCHCCGFLVAVSVSVAVSKKAAGNPPRRRCVKLSHSASDKAKSNKALEAPKSVTSDGFPYSFVMCQRSAAICGGYFFALREPPKTPPSTSPGAAGAPRAGKTSTRASAASVPSDGLQKRKPGVIRPRPLPRTPAGPPADIAAGGR